MELERRKNSSYTSSYNRFTTKHTQSRNAATIQGINSIAATIQCPIDLNYPMNV
ncbi:hypothetical protein HanHA89_Chr08g0305051 [Helianthus annuus]|nr:hypothetical protein HanHA89_Chr08g0305051 [Helianthus annuus]